MVAEYKVPIVDEFTEKLEKSQSAVVAKYHGLTVHEVQTLRRELKANNAEMKVMKNTLARKACERIGMESFGPELKGPLAFILSYEEAPAGPKVAIDFAKEHEAFEIRAGFTEGAMLDAAGVKALASMPSKDELRASFLKTLMAPQMKFMKILQAPQKEFLQTLTAKADEGE